MATKRHIDGDRKIVTIEFSNGSTFGPIEFNPTTDLLTKMIGMLDSRLSTLEAKTGR
jgi:hypothetical protein